MGKITLENANNGFIITYKGERYSSEATHEVDEYEVFQSDDVKESLTNVFEWIAEFYGVGYNKYSDSNLSVSWDKKGHKLE